MKKQRDIIKQLSDKELKYQLLFSQFILFILSIILSVFLFHSLHDWFAYFHFHTIYIIYFGIGTGIVIVGFDLLIIYLLPAKWYDDGGINERIFKNRSIADILLIVGIVSIAEEFLFRGVIQTTFGYIIASTLFALVHIRYLSKPVLFISVLITSFYIGWIFEITGSLLVTITAHFIVD